jgi:aspartate aminotransferase-like enzyme
VLTSLNRQMEHDKNSKFIFERLIDARGKIVKNVVQHYGKQIFRIGSASNLDYKNQSFIEFLYFLNLFFHFF